MVRQVAQEAARVAAQEAARVATQEVTRHMGFHAPPAPLAPEVEPVGDHAALLDELRRLRERVESQVAGGAPAAPRT
ncbi:unnamed protein product [Cochlearia groenlandica]